MKPTLRLFSKAVPKCDCMDTDVTDIGPDAQTTPILWVASICNVRGVTARMIPIFQRRPGTA